MKCVSLARVECLVGQDFVQAEAPARCSRAALKAIMLNVMKPHIRPFVWRSPKESVRDAPEKDEACQIADMIMDRRMRAGIQRKAWPDMKPDFAPLIGCKCNAVKAERVAHPGQWGSGSCLVKKISCARKGSLLLKRPLGPTERVGNYSGCIFHSWDPDGLDLVDIGLASVISRSFARADLAGAP